MDEDDRVEPIKRVITDVVRFLAMNETQSKAVTSHPLLTAAVQSIVDDPCDANSNEEELDQSIVDYFNRNET